MKGVQIAHLSHGKVCNLHTFERIKRCFMIGFGRPSAWNISPFRPSSAPVLLKMKLSIILGYQCSKDLQNTLEAVEHVGYEVFVGCCKVPALPYTYTSAFTKQIRKTFTKT